jgi:hypothetical protein
MNVLECKVRKYQSSFKLEGEGGWGNLFRFGYSLYRKVLRDRKDREGPSIVHEYLQWSNFWSP